MRQMRDRLTYANVMATLAFFIALGGASAFAATQLAKNSVGTKQLKKGAVTTAKIAKGTRAALAGSTGPKGASGPPGSPAASVFASRFHNEALVQTLFGPVSGIGPATNTEEQAVTEASPPVPIVARDLFARYVESGAMAGGTREFTLRVNGVDTALSCTYTTPATGCSDTSDAVAIPPGTLLATKFFQAGTNIGGGDVIVSFRGTTP